MAGSSFSFDKSASLDKLERPLARHVCAVRFDDPAVAVVVEPGRESEEASRLCSIARVESGIFALLTSPPASTLVTSTAGLAHADGGMIPGAPFPLRVSPELTNLDNGDDEPSVGDFCRSTSRIDRMDVGSRGCSFLEMTAE